MSEGKFGINVLHLLLGKALRAPLWLFISSSLARLLGPEGLGSWSMLLAAGMLLNQIFLHWTQSITQRFARAEWLEERKINAVMGMRWPLLAVGCLGCLIVLLVYPELLRQLFGGLNTGQVLLAFFAFWLMSEVQSIQQVRERFLELAWAPITADMVVLLVMFGVYLKFSPLDKLSENDQLTVLLVAIAVGWFCWLLVELRSVRFQWRAPQLKRFPEVVLFAIPLIPGFLVAYFSEWCDYFLIRNFYSSHEVGLFHPPYQYLLVFVGLPTALVSVLLPKAVELFDRQGNVALHQFVEHHAPRYIFCWGAATLIPLAVLPWFFQLLVGNEFGFSVALLNILLAAVPGAVVQHLYGIAYFLRGRLLLSTFLFFLVKLLANALVSTSLLPLVGVKGSAFGAMLSYLILQWLFVMFAVPGKLPPTRGVTVLAWCQLAGLILCVFDSVVLRLFVSIVVLLISFLCLRFTSLFDAREISLVLPACLRRFENFLLRWLARS